MSLQSLKQYRALEKKHRKLSRRLADAVKQGLLALAQRLKRRVEKLAMQLKAFAKLAGVQVAAGTLVFSLAARQAKAQNLTLTEDLAHQNPLVTAKFWGSRITFVDLYNRGLKDVVMGSAGKDGALSFYKNTGSASQPAYTQLIGSANPLSNVAASSGWAYPAFVDLSHTGKPDLVLGNGIGSLQYFKNIGSPSAPSFVELTGTANPLSITALSLPTLNGTGNSETPTASSIPSFVDIDGNGTYDLLVSVKSTVGPKHLTTSGSVYNSGSTFRPQLLFFKNIGSASAPQFVPDTASAATLRAWYNPSGVQAFSFVDLDGNGTFDAVVGKNTLNSYYSTPSLPVNGSSSGKNKGVVSYYKNIGTPSNPSFSVQNGAANPFGNLLTSALPSVALADLDGNGTLDLMLASDDNLLNAYSSFSNSSSIKQGNVAYYKNVGSSTSPKFQAQGIQVVSNNRSGLALGDITHSGKLQVLIPDAYGTPHYYVNQGASGDPNFVELTGTANPLATIPVNTAYGSPAFVDLSGTGKLDLVPGTFTTGTSAYILDFYKNTGTASSPSYVKLTGTANPLSGALISLTSLGGFRPVFADLRRAGAPDLFVGTRNSIQYFKNIGTPSSPSFLTQTATPFGTYAPLGEPSIAFLDVNGDGLQDALVSRQISGDFYAIDYLQNTGTATAPAFSKITGSANPFNGMTFTGPVTLAVGDVAGNGTVGVMVAEARGDVRIFLGPQPSANASAFGTEGVSSFGKPVFGPVPVKGGQPICLFYDKPAQASHWQIYNVAGEKVASADFNAGQACAATNSLAPGVYVIRASINYNDGTSATQMQKIVVVP